MGKSNNLHNKFEKKYQIEKNLNNFFRKDEIQIIKNINDFFSKKITIDFSNFLKKNIKLVSYSIKISRDIENNIKHFRFINLIETSSKQKFFIIFSSDFLSTMINILFGGSTNATEKNNELENITYSESSINKKIIRFITDCLFHTYQKFFSKKITCINTKVFVDLKDLDLHYSKIFLKTCFHLKINNTKIFFSLLSNLETIKELNQKIVHVINNNKDIKIKKNIPNTFALADIYNVELNIVARIINISISHNEFHNLSVGSIFLIKKPDKIFAFIENKPIFFGQYKRFNEKSIIFIEEFINYDLSFNQDKENILMNNNTEKRSDNKKLIDSDKKTIQHENVIETIPDASEKESDNKNILLDTVFDVTVELGRSKIKIKDFLGFSKGSMLVLDKLIKEPLDIFINGQCMASGEIVFLENQYGLRITRIKNDLKKTINVSV